MNPARIWPVPQVAGVVRLVAQRFRVMLRHKGVTTGALASLALGIAVPVVAFSFSDAVFFAPLPYSNAQRIVVPWTAVRASSDDFEPGLPPQVLQVLRTTNVVLRDWATTRTVSVDVRVTGSLRSERAALVSPHFFSLLGGTPLLGRPLSVGDFGPLAPATVVLGHRYWQRAFGSDSTIVGREVAVDGRGRVVVGVMPARWDFPDVALWMPDTVSLDDLSARRGCCVLALARIDAGISANAVLGAVSHHQITVGESHVSRDVQVKFEELRAYYEPRAAYAFTAFASLIALVGVACASLSAASLFASRGLQRRPEFAIRAALGASRAALVRQLALDAFVVASASGIIAVALSVAGVGSLRSWIGASLPDALFLTLSWRMAVLAIVLAFALAIVSSVLPCLAITRNLEQVARSGHMSGQAPRLQKRLLAGQLGVALALAMGVVPQLVRSLNWTDQFDAKASGTLIMNLRPGHAQANVTERLHPLPADWIEIAKAIPQVRDAAIEQAAVVPISVVMRGHAMGATSSTTDQFAGMRVVLASGGVPILPDVRLVRGRLFTRNEAVGAIPVAVVNVRLARMLFGAAAAVGKVITFDTTSLGSDVAGAFPRSVEITGVVADVPSLDRVLQDPLPTVFLPSAKLSDWPMTMVVSIDGATVSARPQLAKVFAQSLPNTPLDEVVPLSTIVERELQASRRPVFVLVVLGGCGLLTALIGVVGVAAQVAAARRGEIAIRVALGATWRNIAALVVREFLPVVVVGIISGLLGAELLLGVLGSLIRSAGRVGVPEEVAVVAAFVLLVVTTVALAMRPVFRVPPAEAIRLAD